MSRRLTNISLALAASAALSLSPLFAQDAVAPQENPAPEAAASEEAQDDDAIVFDENAPEENATDVDEAVAAALKSELEDGEKENSAEDLLNLATELKLSASNLLDLSKVVALCQEAEKKGLDDANLEFSKQLRLSAQLDRGLTVAQLFLNDELPIDQLPRGWEALRDKATEDLEAALADGGDIPIANLSLARLYMLKDDFDAAKTTFEKAFASADAEPQVKALALKYRAALENDETKSVEYLEKAIEAVPDAAELRAQLATSFLSTRRLDDALAQIDKALELDAENNDYRRLKANILAESGKIDEAKTLFDEAVKDEGDNVLIQVEKGQFLASIKEYDAALEHFSKLIDEYGGPGLYFFRGVLYLQKKDYDAALADVNKALRLDGSMTQALRLKGIIFLQQEKYDDAIRIFEQLKRKSDDKTEATLQIAYANGKKGLYKKAAQILDAELEKAPESVDVLRSYADMELMFGHWEAAAARYEQILKLAPNDSGALNNYSWLLSTCPDDARRDGAKALELGQLAAEKTFFAAPHILSTLAAAHAELGDFEKAREWAAKAVELGEKEEHESLDNLKKELESYKENKPWRETSEIVAEVDEEPADANAEKAETQDETENEKSAK